VENELERKTSRERRTEREGASKEYARRQEDWSGAREIKQLVTLHRGSSQRDLIMFSV